MMKKLLQSFLPDVAASTIFNRLKLTTATTITMLLVFSAEAQKKVTPVTQSTLTSIALPAGSKQDSRMLTVAGAKMLLEMESKKANIILSSPEVLMLPPVTAGGFNADSLLKNLSDQGWAVSVIEGDKKYAWLQKDNRNLIMYFSMDAKQTGLYFAEAASAPVQNGQGNTTGTIQTEPTEINKTQQTTNTTVQTVQTEVVQQPTPPVTNSGFAFTKTNFDDGWTSTVQENWVEVTKGTTKVLIHYSNKKADAYNSVLMDGLKNAWNVLVAPRYSNASNMEFKPVTGWQSIEFAEADMTDNNSRKKVHVVFFKMNYSNGSGKYLEFITPDKNSFEREFGAYHETSYGWEKPAAMQYRNKFSVAANDLIGKWSTTDYASVSYYYVNTGGLASTSTTSTADEFIFSAGNIYQSQHSGASGEVGNIKFSNQEYKGKSTVTNWDITLTNRFQGATEKYDCYFEAIKGGRFLLMTDRLGTTHALVKK